MNRIPAWLLILALYPHLSGAAQTEPVINEVVTSNITGLPDEYDIIPYNCPVENCTEWYNDLGKSVYDGEYPGWVEIYNPTPSDMNLSGYGLSDDSLNLQKWTFPDISIPSGGHVLVFVSGKDRKINTPPGAWLHSNFKLKQSGESIFLSNPGGSIIDHRDVSNIIADFSLGRRSDGADSWTTFVTPTPLSSNSGQQFSTFSDAVTPSLPPGLYGSAMALSFSVQTAGAEIRYTLDGDDPSPGSFLFNDPVLISESLVIKARAYKNGVFISPVFTGTYIMGEHQLPVVCISTPPANLWDGETGIYTPGNNADEGNRIANYWNDWERPAHIEMYETDFSQAFSIDAGIKIFGWGSRANQRRSLAVMIRDKYGVDALNYQLFPDSQVDQYKSFVLRNAGQDWQQTLIRDPLLSQLAKKLDVERQHFRYCIVYLNGEYWGIHNIRSKLNEDYLSSHSWVDKDSVDIISRYWRRSFPLLIEGDDDDYLYMENYIALYDLSQADAYAQVESMIDIQNIIDYYAINVFAANEDWPGNNNKCWRSNNPESKWRWIMYDLDNCLIRTSHNTISQSTLVGGTSWPNPDYTTIIFRNLLENEGFKYRFLNKISDLMNTMFRPSNMENEILQFKDQLRSEMEKHISLWGSYGASLTSIDQWESNISEISAFSSLRPEYLKIQLKDYFGLSAWHTITVNFNREGAGKVGLNSVQIENSGWTGSYPAGVPIRLSALPLPGYKFAGWSGVDGDRSKPTIEVSLTGDLTIRMNLIEDPGAINNIVINEVCYNPAPSINTGDWVELYNGFDFPVDLSAWVLKDSQEGNSFKIPKNTVIQPDGYLVLCQENSDLLQFFPQVTDYAGDFNFGFNHMEESIRLFDPQKNLVDQVSYQNTPPWPTMADGSGPSLSLISPDLDNSEPGSWSSSVHAGGTPGAENVWTTAEATYAFAENEVQVYPNPFISEVNFSIQPGKAQHIQIEIYDLYGRMLGTAYEGQVEQGFNRIVCNLGNIHSGLNKVLIYRIKGESILESGTLIKLQ